MIDRARKELAIVTCLYDLVKRGSPGHRTVDQLFGHSAFVLGLDRELVIFTEPELETEVRKRRGDRPTTIVTRPYEELLRSDRALGATLGERERNGSTTKVTPPYVQLTWAKFAMLEHAVELTSDRASHIGWIDVGITHVAKLPPRTVDIFADPSDAPRVHVLRIFSKVDVEAPDYWHDIRGHLAGGLFVGERSRMLDLAARFWSAVDRAIAMGLAPQEEGLLAYVVGQAPFDFSYSYGNYEDVLRNHDAPREGNAYCKWIVEEARTRGLPGVMGFAADGQAGGPA